MYSALTDLYRVTGQEEFHLLQKRGKSEMEKAGLALFKSTPLRFIS